MSDRIITINIPEAYLGFIYKCLDVVNVMGRDNLVMAADVIEYLRDVARDVREVDATDEGEPLHPVDEEDDVINID